MTIASVNPATGETLETFEAYGEARVSEILARAAATFPRFRQSPFADRAAAMQRVAEMLETNAERYGRILTLEMGKTLKSAIAEVKKCALACGFYAENAERLLADEEARTSASRSYVTYQPLGVILGVMPWNFPFWQVFRFAAPTVMAGNVIVIKHASNVPRSALTIEEIFREAFGEGVVQTLLIGSEHVARVIDDERVAAVTLTGSEAAGAAVASQAAKQIKKAVLELGGSDPFIVMPSADLAKAVSVAVTARMINNGQSCIAAKRFIVHRSIADEFASRFVGAVSNLVVGDPLDEKTDIGPLATPRIVADLEKQVAGSIRMGARILTGGKRIGARGNFYAPTVISDIPPDAPAYCEELFGPVASLFYVDGVDDAIRIANATEFGLGSSVWTNDPDERMQFIRGIEAGQVFINAMVASDPHVPFGGVKKSGFGRELGVHGIREFVNAKTVWIEEAAPKITE